MANIDNSCQVERPRIVFASVLLGMLVGALNQTVVGTAIPRITADLNGVAEYSWVFTSFMIASAVSLLIFGKLSDMYGRKMFFMGGISILMVGSACAGLSQTMLQLILFRVVQGVGAGMLMSTSMGIVGDLFPPSEQAKWRALNQGVFTLASIFGPLLGGLLTDHLSWRWVFYINFPVGIAALTFATLVMPPLRNQRGHGRIDYFGAAVLILMVVPLLVAFSCAGTRYPWGSVQIVGMLSFSVAMFLLYVFAQSKADEPILSLNLFRNPIFAIVGIANFLLGLGLFGSITYLPLFIQGVQGQSATNSGIILMPMMLASFTAGVIGGQLLSRWGRYRILALISMAVSSIGMFLLSLMTADTTSATVSINMVILGLGFGISMPLFFVVVQNAFPQRMVGTVVSSSAFLRSVGGTLGVAIMGTLVANKFKSGFRESLSPEIIRAVDDAAIEMPSSPQALLSSDIMGLLQDAVGPELSPAMMETMQSTLASALSTAFLFSSIALAVAFVACLFLKEIPLRRSNQEGSSVVESASKQ